MSVGKETAVIYKAPKRMKKRRQLDALVDTVKLPRHRKSSTSQELLDYDSDSSENEEFSIAGLNSRKTKCCFCQGIVLRIGLFMVTMACLSICLGLVWVQWHLRHEIVVLQEKFKSVQSPDQGKGELALLQTQVKDIENSLKELKKSDGIFENLKSTVSDFGVRLRKVEASTEKLNQSVGDAQSLLNTPKELKSLAGTVASLGSELKEGEKTQSAKTTEVENRLSALEANQLEKSSEMMQKKSSVDEQFRDMLSQQITEVNETAKSQIANVRNDLSLLQGRLSALESYSQSKESGLGHDEVESLVMALIQEKMTNMTQSSVAATSNELTDGSPDALSQLSERVNYFTQILNSKADFADNMDLVSKGDFILFKGDTLMNFETVNKTVFSLSAELESLMHRLDAVDAAVLNMSALLIPKSEQVDDNQGDNNPVLSSSNSRSTTVSTVEGVPKTSVPSASSSQNPQGIDQESQGLQIEGIETAEDLHKAWETWPQIDGQLSTDVVLSLLKNNSTEITNTLETFDTNFDSFFSEEELQNALDLQDVPPPRR
ncbi:hypothetical protein EGW08_012027 [Elysia chlorotica]|uniref:EF-hand domain-containing protein n=1 Tax=Elysia chlorotica TaxID=188477 RepID=A0A3S0ZQ43_ELYCH|nr:hypothetical protein EGW08_012027 [Elysia chlorotica]